MKTVTYANLLTSEEVKKIRKRLGWTQAEAIELCGGGKNAFTRYESGELNIPIAASNLLKLLDYDEELVSLLID